MAFLNIKCTVCGKAVSSLSYRDVLTTRFHKLSCGHAYTERLIKKTGEVLDEKTGEVIDPYEQMESLTGEKLYPFQIEACHFAEKSNMRTILAHEMGLGKTVIQLALLKAHLKDALPAVIICKSAIKAQYAHMFTRWLGLDALVQEIYSSKDFILPGMKAYIFSFDILRRFVKRVKVKKIDQFTKVEYEEDVEINTLAETFQKLGVKTLIIDEAQLVKNTDAQRSRHLRELSKGIPYILASSGSPVENHAGEYFSILNMVRPDKFRIKQAYLNDWCDTYYNGYTLKVGGLRNPKEFKEYTSDFIIRRTRSEVLPDLPQVTRSFQMCEIEDKGLGDAYNATSDELLNYATTTSDNAFLRATNILAYMAKMRHICGLSKIPAILDFVEDFLMNTDRKLTIFVHHKDVGQILVSKIDDAIKLISGSGTVTALVADLGSEERYRMVQEFGEDKAHRIMVASTLSAAEGLNFQKWSDCVMAEQQWNPSKEKQAEDRFPRIGQQASKVYATYFIALNTIDEYLADLKEQKRVYVQSAVDFVESDWTDAAVTKLLTEKIIEQGRRGRWKL